MNIYLLLYVWMPFVVCAGSYTHKTQAPEPSVPNITVIALYDDVVLKMDGASKKNAIVHSDAVNMIVQDGVLTLRASRDANSLDYVVYYNTQDHFKHVKEIRIYDSASLEAKSTNAPYILRNESSESSKIDGYVPLIFLENKGQGSLSIDWVSSQDIDIRVHHGSVHLAGVAKRARYRIDNKATLDARHLRVDDMWALGQGRSISFLMPVHQSHCIVTGDAQLLLENKPYYYSTLVSGKGEIIYNNLFALSP